MTTKSLLIGDIGGTNARFAFADPDKPGFSDAMTLKVADHATVLDAIRHYLSQTGVKQLDVICLAVAGPVVADSVDFTNNHWAVSADELRTEFSVQGAQLLNDFEAVAYAIAQIGRSDYEVIGDAELNWPSNGDFRVAVVGPGTGFGAAGLIKRSGTLVPVVGEGGHLSFAPQSDQQMQLLVAMQSKFAAVSLENLVQGQA